MCYVRIDQDTLKALYDATFLKSDPALLKRTNGIDIQGQAQPLEKAIHKLTLCVAMHCYSKLVRSSAYN